MAKKAKATKTEARRAFDVNIQRASYFLDIHEEAQQGAGAPPLPYRELPRGAVVFAVGALDAYLSEVSAEVMVRDFQSTVASNDARETLKRIQSDLPTLALEISVLENHNARLQRIRDVIVDHFQNRVSMHGVKAVSATAGRIGAKALGVWSALDSRSFAGAQASLDKWTDIRHQVVHQGKKPTVRRPDARKCLSLITEIVDVLDGLACKQ
jgi:hypothetical protein